MSPTPPDLAFPTARPPLLVIDDDASLCTALTVALEDDFTVETGFV